MSSDVCRATEEDARICVVSVSAEHKHLSKSYITFVLCVENIFFSLLFWNPIWRGNLQCYVAFVIDGAISSFELFSREFAEFQKASRCNVFLVLLNFKRYRTGGRGLRSAVKSFVKTIPTPVYFSGSFICRVSANFMKST